MRLADIMALRPRVCAGLLVTLTDRCPLSCAHCSTSSTLAGQELDADQLVDFLGTCTTADRPDVVMLTGGEPMMRPDLVVRVAERVRAAGAATAVLTGAFFARGRRLPDPIGRAIAAVDHVSVSTDAFHEREVPRADVFAFLRRLLDLGVDTSLHIVGTSDDDPYLADVTDAVRLAFGDRVPMLVNEVRAVGRARAWASRAPARPGSRGVVPCAMAAWPVVTVDGGVTACCNQDVVDGRVSPAHLRLGHITTDTWPRVRARAAERPLLRMVRTVGPVYVESGRSTDTCASCHHLDDRSASGRWAAEVASGPVGRLLERDAASRQDAAGVVGLLSRYGSARYAHLVGGGQP